MIIQALPAEAVWGKVWPELASAVATGKDWLKQIPGKTVAAIHLAMLTENIESPHCLSYAQQWLGEGTIIGSRMGSLVDGQSHSVLLTKAGRAVFHKAHWNWKPIDSWPCAAYRLPNSFRQRWQWQKTVLQTSLHDWNPSKQVIKDYWTIL